MNIEIEKSATRASPEKDQCEASTSTQPPQCGTLMNDRISELPDEILADILSQVKMKEAGKTSILSKRWRHVWTSVNNLDFDALETLHDLSRRIKFLEVERPIYVRWVNEAIRRHQRLSIDEFIVRFDLNESFSSDIDNWINFALGKRVQKLKLDLRNKGRYLQSNCYSLPRSLEISSCTSLTSLQLFGVNISGEVLQLLVSNLPELESVLVFCSRTLVNLDVDGPSKLKWLEVSCCPEIKCIRISAPNLLSFKYFGARRIKMSLRDVPMLVEISIQGPYVKHLEYNLPELSSYAPRLETLTLEADITERYYKGVDFPEFPNLKHLTLVIPWKGVPMTLLSYDSLIKACPRLYKMSVQMPYPCKPHAREMLKADSCPHNIKVVEFDGFQGRDVDTEFAAYLIENAVILEKITFNTRCPLDEGSWVVFKDPEYWDRSAARECAREIGKQIRAGTKLIIL